jgi:hypothetical protein
MSDSPIAATIRARGMERGGGMRGEGRTGGRGEDLASLASKWAEVGPAAEEEPAMSSRAWPAVIAAATGAAGRERKGWLLHFRKKTFGHKKEFRYSSTVFFFPKRIHIYCKIQRT